MNLIVDIGNTAVKLALFDADRLVSRQQTDVLDRAAVEAFLRGQGVAEAAIVSSTRGDAAEAAETVRGAAKRVVVFTPQLAVPLENRYHTPATLGCDRLAAAVGAAACYPGRNALVVDLGTALTIDFVSADGVYHGGSISPGMSMRFRALHDYTARLPLGAPTDERTTLGYSTRSAVELGVMNGIAFEIEGYIARLEADFADLCIIFTGGDAKFFDKRIKNTIFADCNLVLCGLNRILKYHASEENHS